MKKKNILILTLTSLLLIAGAILFLGFRIGASHYSFDTEEVSKGSVSITVTATGTLEATNTVEVGTQVSGVIEKLYVDFNSVVKKGQLIAELDKSTLLSDLETKEADVNRAQAEYDYQESNLARMKVLNDQEMLATSDYDLAIYNYKISKASLKSAKANYEKAERNLGYATIYSPIDGVVLNRAVEEGQTVAASMNTPELYTITNDLSIMQVEADVDEADIGMIKMEQRVEFTVDAFPNDTFTGEVSEVRLQPNETSNVVTYTVIVTVSNPEQKLKPGMTASITDYVDEANDVLLLPGKAIRFQPDQELLKDYMSSLPKDQQAGSPQQGKQGKQNTDGQQKGPMGPPPCEETGEDIQMVWIQDGSFLRPVPIKTGINDGSNIEILSGLSEGDQVVTSMEKVTGKKAKAESKVKEEQSSPFVQERGGGPGGPPH